MEETKPHILIVDDDSRIIKLLKKFFQQHGFLVSSALSTKEAEEVLLYFTCDLVILDVMLPGVTGLDFAKTLKDSTHNMPIIMLTALSGVEDRIRGLETGANDYLTKPFEPKELLLRVQNLINSYNQHKQELQIRRFGNNYYNFNSKEFFKNNQLVTLSITEQNLLEILMEDRGTIISRQDLSSKIGGLSSRAIDVQITRLRSKIEDDPKFPKHLKTIRGIGYVLYT